MADKCEAVDTEGLPVDVELIKDSVDVALSLSIGTSTRQDIAGRTNAVVGHLALLVTEDLGTDSDGEVLALVRKAYKLLDLDNRPRSTTPTFEFYEYMRRVAVVTRALVTEYEKKSGVRTL